MVKIPVAVLSRRLLLLDNPRLLIHTFPTTCTYQRSPPLSARPEGEVWDVFAACCLQRFPVIQAPLTELEQRAKEMFRHMEVRSSLLSEHEVRHRNDQALLKKKKAAAKGDTTGLTVESGPFITALEAEDMWEAEKNRFKLAPRLTEADEKNDTASMRRCLDRKLVLVVEQKIGNNFHLVMPQMKWQNGESLRQTAERALSSLVPVQQSAGQFLGNAPCGVYSYRYPKVVRQQLKKDGAKVFFFKAHLMDWQSGLKLSDAGDATFRKPQWLTKDELQKALQKDYARTVGQFLLDF